MNTMNDLRPNFDDMMNRAIFEEGIFVHDLQAVDERLTPDFMQMIGAFERYNVYQKASRNDREGLDLIIGSYENAFNM